MSNSLRQSSDCGYGSQIFSNDEFRNIQSDEKRLKTVPTKKLLYTKRENFLIFQLLETKTL